MSDDDFVSFKPIRTYKRRKKTAPLATTVPPVSVDVLLQSPEKTTKHAPSCTAHDKPHISQENVRRSMTDLEAFLSDKDGIIGGRAMVMNQSDLPELEIETVQHNDEDDFVETKKPPSPEKAAVDLEDIKSATKVLCDKTNSKTMRQSSLMSLIKSKGNGDTKYDPKSASESDQCSPKKQSPPNKPKTSTPNPARKSATTQLDLGVMFGMKPKEPEPQKCLEKKAIPSYKRIKGTSFTVDAFNFGEIPNCTAYFLSHFHSDHYMGLNKRFSSLLYCTKVTASYVIDNLKVNPACVKSLNFDETYNIQGMQVSLIEANHCPGSAMFLFDCEKTGTSILHTGDFRYNAAMLQHPLLVGKAFDVIYLDTTYFDPIYVFPAQEEVIRFMEREAEGFSSDTLVVCGSYTIGKEKLVDALAKKLDCKVCVTAAKMKLLQHQENEQFYKRLVRNVNARLHIVPMKDINTTSLSKLLARTHYRKVVGIKPTGWTHCSGATLTDLVATGSGSVRLYPLPYSEHSSYSELEQFIRSVSAKKIVSTVLPRTEEKRRFMFEKIKLWGGEEK